MGTFKENKEFSDSFAPQVISILNQQFKQRGIQDITVASPKMDKEYNADFLILLKDKTRLDIAFRVRKKFDDIFDVTIRTKTGKGSTYSEYHKILKGFGDYMLYSVSPEAGAPFEIFYILDLKILSSFFKDEPELIQHFRSKSIKNDDGSEGFGINIMYLYDYNPNIFIYCSDTSILNFKKHK